MKRFMFLSILLLLLTVGFSSQLYAQGDPVIIVPPSNPDSDGDGVPNSDDQCPNKAGPRSNRGCPEDNSRDDNSGAGDSDPVDDPNADSDGDGLSDKDDQCPNAGGPTWTGGCPEGENPPTDPNPTHNDPFVPPALPSDGCYVTPSDHYNVNVRKATDLTALQLGFLKSGVVYKSEAYITVGTDNWFILNQYEGYAGDTGYVLATVIKSSGCDESVAGGDSENPTQLAQNNIKQLGIALHNYQEGCTLVAQELGIYQLKCIDDLSTGDDGGRLPGGWDGDDADIDLAWILCPEGWVVRADGTLICEPLVIDDDKSIDDCDQNGIPDLGEFFPPDCINDLSTGDDGGRLPDWDGDDADIDLAWILCPDGWVVRADGTFECAPLIIDGDEFILDCNKNGIPDLDEFILPDCFGKLTTDTGRPTADDGPEDFELDFLWEQCPDGWVWYEDEGLVCEPLIVED